MHAIVAYVKASTYVHAPWDHMCHDSPKLNMHHVITCVMTVLNWTCVIRRLQQKNFHRPGTICLIAYKIRKSILNSGF
eukprot:jgi/Botrbrau1/15539/Bobra.0333s0005.1